MRRGQVLVVVLFVLAIGITVAMAISSRSVTEISVSTTQDESSRALEAAQVGLERYLSGLPFQFPATEANPASGDISETNSTYYVPATTMVGGQTYYELPYPLMAGDVATVDLPETGYTGVEICWCKSDATCPAAVQPKIEAEFFYRLNGAQYMKQKPFYGGAAGNYYNFTAASNSSNCGMPSNNFRYSVNINFNTDDSGQNVRMQAPGLTTLFNFVRVRMLGNGNTDVNLAIQLLGGSSGVVFPEQSAIVESVGTSGDTVQKIRAEVMRYDLPGVFDAAIFSGGSLIKN
jgi:hypothetical protein